MMRLEQSLRAWGTRGFEAVLKQEVVQLNACHLPLQQGLTVGNYVAAAPVSMTIIAITECGNVIRVKAGIFYQGVIGGCTCEGDPTPASDINEYCEVLLEIDKANAVTAVTLAPEPAGT